MNSELKLLTGIDIVKNLRIRKLIDRSPEAIADIFSEREIAYCNRKKFSEQSFGVRFAVKEAIIKATDSDILQYELNQIETVNTDSGKPQVKISNDKLIKKIQNLLGKDNYSINVTVSHEKEFSIAMVIIY